MFFPLPGTFEQLRAALRAGPGTYGNVADVPWWTTAGRSAVGNTSSSVEVYVCVPAETDQRPLDRDGFVTDVRAALDDPALPVVAGVLPARWEVSCTADVDHDEQASMASGLVPRLAIDTSIPEHVLRPVALDARELESGALGTSVPVTVRDVAPPTVRPG